MTKEMAINILRGDVLGTNEQTHEAVFMAIKALKEQPTVDPVKHGHWIEVQRLHETDHTAICECSLCGDTVWVYDGQRAWNYCPNCGAKMDENEWEEPEINPCRGCVDYDGQGGCKSNGGCGAEMDEVME